MERRRYMLGCLAGLVACRQRVARYPLPPVVTLYVVVSEQVAKNDTGNVSGMVDALEQELRDAGHAVEIVGAHDNEKPPLPRIELRVMTSEGADSETLAGAQLGTWAGAPMGVGVIAIGAGGSIVVDGYLVPGGNQPVSFLGRFESGTFMAMTEDSQTVAGERAGKSIARRLRR